VNKLITLDTPHNGSPLANFFVEFAKDLNRFPHSAKESIKQVFIKNTIAIMLGLNSPLIKSSYSFDALFRVQSSDALKNLQTANLGKNFNSTVIQALLIAGDLFPGSSSNFDNIDWSRLNVGENKKFINLFDNILDLICFTNLKSKFFNTSDYSLITSYILIRNKPERVFKLLSLIYKKLFNSNTMLSNSDLVVSLESQQANIPDPLRKHVFDKFNGINNSLGVGHTLVNQCYYDKIIRDTVLTYINLPSNNENFIQIIPQTPSTNLLNINENFSITENLNLDTLNHVVLISPLNSQIVNVGDDLNVNFTIDDTTNLKYIKLNFQGNDYYDTVKSFSYNYNITVNGNELDSVLFSVDAVYVNGDSINYSSEFRTLFVNTNEFVANFSVKNNFYFLSKNQIIIPDYKSVFTNHITEGPLSNIISQIGNAGIISFDNTKKSFEAISTGETYAIVSNGGQSDTIYFVVNGELLSPGNTTLVSPIDSAKLPSSNVKFDWNVTEYASNYSFQISEDINFSHLIYRYNNLINTTITIPSIDDSTKYFWRVKAVNSVGEGEWSEVRSFTPVTIRPSHFHITLIPEGFYDDYTNGLRRRDTVKAYMINNFLPFNIIDSSMSVIDSISFLCAFEFNNAQTGNYYIKINHLNSLETWSKDGGEIFKNGDLMKFNFTTDNSNAYGNNQILKGKNWCLYSGDVNQDGTIDASDISSIDNDANINTKGYVLTDLTGDYYVDASDLSIVENNAGNSVMLIRP